MDLLFARNRQIKTCLKKLLQIIQGQEPSIGHQNEPPDAIALEDLMERWQQGFGFRLVAVEDLMAVNR